MDYQIITGKPDATDHLVFTTIFTHNNVFYKAALAETISWEVSTSTRIPALETTDEAPANPFKLENDWLVGPDQSHLCYIPPSLSSYWRPVAGSLDIKRAAVGLRNGLLILELP